MCLNSVHNYNIEAEMQRSNMQELKSHILNHKGYNNLHNNNLFKRKKNSLKEQRHFFVILC